MPEPTDPLDKHVADAGAGLSKLLAEAQATWLSRAESDGLTGVTPGWRAFDDAFPTFYQFTNRPR